MRFPLLFLALVSIGGVVSSQTCPLDATFGSGGVVVADLGGTEEVTSAALQSDGKIVVGGRSSSSVALARFHPDGTLDTSFGSGTGFVIGPPGSVVDLALQSDGRILVARGGNFTVMRYLADGTLDTSFSGGTTSIPDSFSASGLGQLSTGRVVGVGDCCSGPFSNPDATSGRYLADGTPDAAYGGGGSGWVNHGEGDLDSNVVVASDDTFVAAGIDRRATGSRMLVMRFNGTGGLIWSKTTTFGGTWDRAFAVSEQPDGKVLAGGNAQNLGANALARYHGGTGALDTAFGTGGLVTTAGAPTIGAIDVASDGRIYVNGSGNLGVLRYLSDGTVDTGYGSGGTVNAHVAAATEDLVLQPDGKVVVVGAAAGDFAVARYGGGPFASVETVRAGSPPNPAALLPGQTSGPVIGAVWDPVVDHASFVLGAVADFVLLTGAPANTPLGAEGTLLCDLTSPLFEFVTAPAVGSPFAIPVPDKCALVGLELCAQGGSVDGLLQGHLANALDVVVGSL